MNILHRTHGLAIVFAALAGAALSAGAAGQVDVAFAQDTRFTDAGSGAFERDRNEQSLAKYMRHLGERLPEGQVLKVEITDIDLAGWQHIGPREVRVLRGGADWPRIALRYELLEQGRTVKAGADDLADMDYLHSLRTLPETDLPYEKRMLADWFDTRIAPR